ncbi:MAG: hypothetical protein K9N47_11645 [Prosthecobacter sp.]|uniref:hypothetical protein n=1 Tax=Prosthecobacter sp. TaxID=1965333 RepID=UPI0025E7940E|nr:hypothetical protein [Prosthecobacter sp.]MCF7786768.1 hypothetical protein [Prosthecobacter sp.]
MKADSDSGMPVDLQLEPADPSRLKRLRDQIQQGPRTPLFAAQRKPEPPFDTP